jgi:hypothetical protein
MFTVHGNQALGPIVGSPHSNNDAIQKKLFDGSCQASDDGSKEQRRRLLSVRFHAFVTGHRVNFGQQEGRHKSYRNAFPTSQKLAYERATNYWSPSSTTAKALTGNVPNRFTFTGTAKKRKAASGSSLRPQRCSTIGISRASNIE